MKGEWLRNWGPALGYAAFIFYMSSQSELPEILPGVPGMDKLAHAFAYAVLSGLVVRPLLCSPRPGWRAHAVYTTIIVCLVYALSDELHQAFVSGRSCEFADWIADAVGAMVMQCAVIAWAT